MERIMYKLKKMSNWYVTVFAGIAFTVAVIIYGMNTKNLVKPANTSEAIEFLLNYSAEYTLALFAGFMAKGIPLLLMLCLLGSILCYFSGNCAYYESDSKDSLKLIIVNAILVIVTLIVQSLFIKFWGTLVFVIAVIAFFVYACINKQ